MPIVVVNAIAGRSIDQKRAVVREITDAFTRHFGVPEDAVSIIFNDMQEENYARAGVLRCDRNSRK